jgi:hypothetical protein
MESLMGRIFAGLIVLLGSAGWARADEAPEPDKAAYTVINPTPESLLRSLCTDRPTKSTGPCTVDAGRWQVESDLYNITIQRGGGATTTTELFTNPTLKLGVTNNLDLEVNMTPYEMVSVRERGVTTHSGGVGDLFIRAKANLVGDDSGNIAVAISPFLKVPTASHAIGNGAVEGGVIVPVQFNLAGGWQLLFDPEFDVLRNAVNGGMHLNTAALVSLSKPVSKTVTLSVEFWTDSNFDATGTITQYSADLGAAWIPSTQPTLQLDGGVNFGLNKATPVAQVYLGISHRF